MGGIGRFFGSIIGSIGEFILTAIEKTTSYLKTLTFQELLALINTSFFIAMYAMITKMAKTFGTVGKSFSGTLDSISEALKGFGGKDETIADKIMKIGIALGILAASAWVLSTIDTKNLIKALVAISVMMVQLSLTMKIMSKMEFGEDAKIMKAAFLLMAMAVAILILASAVKKFEGLSWQDLAKGLIGVSVLLAGLALFTKFADMSGGASVKASVSLIILAVAIRLLATSVEKFGTMDVATLQKGLLVLGLLLAGLAGMTKIMNGAQLMSASIGLLILSGALIVLSKTLEYYAGLDWNMLVDGLSKLAATLISVGISARALPGNLPITALGLIVMAGALAVMIPVLTALGSMPIPVIRQALIVLAIQLGVMAAAMWVMSAPGTLAGAAALVVVVGALYLLLPILITLGSLPLEVVALGLIAIAGVFVIFALGGMALAPVVPVLIAFAAALGLIGLAVMLVGAGIALFGIGFAAMAAAVVAGGAVLVGALQSLIMMLPLFAQQVGLAIVAFGVVIRDSAPVIGTAIEAVIRALITAVSNLIPDIIALFTRLVLEAAWAVERTVPQLAAAGMRMMLDLLTRIRAGVPAIVEQAMLLMHDFLSTVADNIGPIVDEATRLMVEFMDGIERNIPQLVESGERMVRTFIREVGAALLGGVGDMLAAGTELAGNIVTGMVNGIAGGIGQITTAATNLARNALSAAKNFLGIDSPSKEFMKVGRYTDEGFAKGMNVYAGVVTKASEGVGEAAIFAMKKSVGQIPGIMNDEIDMSPKIRPVLDLTAVEQGAKGLDPLLNAKPINVQASYLSARVAETGERSNRIAAEEISAQARETAAAKVEFNQYNTSPKALDRVEIYRQTNNQLSLLKEEFNAASR